MCTLKSKTRKNNNNHFKNNSDLGLQKATISHEFKVDLLFVLEGVPGSGHFDGRQYSPEEAIRLLACSTEI